jgi:GntR family transcriptional regulator, rspAB operon transcriptional repressor
MFIVLERRDRESARDYAYRVLRHNIIELNLTPGSSVSEQSLCNQLAISRTPVREALLDLARQQLVEVVPQRGTKVSLICHRLVEEGYFLRTLVEEAVVRQACMLMDDKYYHQLETNVMMQEYHGKYNDYDEFIRLDNEFHRIIFSICNKDATYRIVTDFQAHLDRERKLSLQYALNPDIIKEHKAVLEAMRKRDPEEAARMMAKHISHVIIDQNRLMEKFPDFFC